MERHVVISSRRISSWLLLLVLLLLLLTYYLYVSIITSCFLLHHYCCSFYYLNYSMMIHNNNKNNDDRNSNTYTNWRSSSFVFIFCPQTWLEPGGDSNCTIRKSRRRKLDSVLCLIYTTTFPPLFHIGSTGLAIRASFFLNKTNLESYWWKCYQMQFEINPYHVTFSRWLSFKTFWLIKISLLCQTENSGSWLWWSWRHELLVGRRSSS